MKPLSKIIFLLTTIYFNCRAQDTIDYHTMIQPCVKTWHNECITELTTQEAVTIADMLLLSYQVVQASVTMSHARLVIQAELLNIATLSINDTFDARMQAQNNDLTKIKDAVTAIEKAQEKIKFACNTLKNFGPLIININPAVIQLFIFNLKTTILNWLKTQEKTVGDLKSIQLEFMKTPLLLSNLSNIFEAISSADQIEHSQLLHGANSLTNMYQNVETMIADLTAIRQESIMNFNTFLTLFFKYHYEILYNQLQNIDGHDIKISATPDHKLPTPDQIFIIV